MSQHHARHAGVLRLDSPLRVVLTYAAVSAIWIVGSDRLMAWWQGDLSRAWIVGSFKGLVFVLVTSLMLYSLVRRLVALHVAAEVALHENQLRWQFALEGAEEGVWDRDLQTMEVFYSRRWKEILGYADDEMNSASADWEDRLHPEDRVRVQAEIARHLKGDTSFYRCEYRLRAKDGSYKWILDRGRVVSRLPDGRPSRMVGTHTDITDRKQAEQGMADSLEFARTVLHSSPMGVITYGPDGQAVMANEAAARIIGTDLAGLLHQNFRQLESWRRDGLLAAADEALESGREVMHSGRLESTFGQSLWLENRFVPFHYEGAKHLLVLVKDVTAERRALESLQLLNEAVRAAPGGWVITDAEGVIEFVNPGFTALTGYTAEEAVGKKPNFLKSGRHSENFYAALWDTIRRGEIWRGELENRRKDGGLYQEHMTIAPVRDMEGRIAHFVAIKQNVSEQKRLESQLARAQRLESIGLLASGIAHDLNNMLAPIMLSIGLIRNRHSDPETLGQLQVMEFAAQRGAGVVRQVLTFARGVEGERVQIEPKHLIKEVAQLAEETFPREIKVEMRIARDVNPVDGDLTQLHQVLLNLALNARDAMPNGGVLALRAQNVAVDATRAARQVTPAAPGNYVSLVVSDTGTGIPLEVLEHMFEPFFTTKPRGKGSGLGLSTVFGIVRSHGGFVEVETELERGTSFNVFLPAAERTAPAPSPAGQGAVDLQGSGLRVLIVDDESAIRGLTGYILSRHGFIAVEAKDGVEAVEKFGAEPAAYAAVIMDLLMPKMNGYQLAEKIRRLSPTVPILASTGMAGDSTVEDGAAALRAQGVRTILHKPYSERELLEALRRELKPAPKA